MSTKQKTTEQPLTASNELDAEMARVSSVDFNKGGGLVPTVMQHHRSGEVLMLGYMDEAALKETINSRWVHFFSRSKNRLWMKGETSGNRLSVQSWSLDCDADALLFKVVPQGPVCHTGTMTCWATESGSTLKRLEQKLQERLADPNPDQSYTAKLAAEGIVRIAQKVGEEGVECALAAVAGSPEQLAGEAADLIYHLLVLLQQRSLQLDDVLAVLEARSA